MFRQDDGMADHDTAGTSRDTTDATDATEPALARGVHIERRDRIAVITVSDPRRRNAMAVDLAAALVERIGAAESDDGVGAVVVTGTPPAFCAGADLVELSSSGKSREDGLREVYAGFVAVANCTLPTVAAVNGAAVGAGMNLALACDVRLAGPAARFDSRFLRLGIHPGGGYTWMAQRILGPQGAAAATLFGEILDAREAERVGLVWRAVEDPVAAAVAMAATAAEAPRDLAVTTKRTLRATANLHARSDALEMEIHAQLASLESPVFAERVASPRARAAGRG